MWERQSLLCVRLFSRTAVVALNDRILTFASCHLASTWLERVSERGPTSEFCFALQPTRATAAGKIMEPTSLLPLRWAGRHTAPGVSVSSTGKAPWVACTSRAALPPVRGTSAPASEAFWPSTSPAVVSTHHIIITPEIISISTN